MAWFRLVLGGIRYHWRLHSGLASGAFVACAVLTGSLLVGHAVDKTLRDIATARLGHVAYALDWGTRYFESALGAVVQTRLHQDTPQFTRAVVAPVLSLRGVAEIAPGTSRPVNRINRAWVYGISPEFGRVASREGLLSQPGPQDALVNEAAARLLGLKPGDNLVLRIPRPAQIPVEAPLASGKERETAVTRVRVLDILADRQAGRFSLAAEQATPANIFVDRDWLGELAGIPGKANLLLANEEAPFDALSGALTNVWQPDLLGYRWRRHPSGALQLESDRLFIEDAMVNATLKIDNARPLLTYLVNRIAVGDRSTPYSFVLAGAVPPDTPKGAVCINRWLADALGAEAGDTASISWYEPLPSGTFKEHSVDASIHAILPMEDLVIERDLAPRFPGLSDVNSCQDWDIGMPLDEEQLKDPQNEAYWKQYGQTPKLSVTFDTGSTWWGNLYGTVTAIRFQNGTTDPEALSEILRSALDPSTLGLNFSPVRQDALDSVAQAIDFGALFTGMSTFLIAAALLLLGLLYAHGLQSRSGELGTVLASGWTLAQTRSWLLLETIPGCLAGALAGSFMGAAYAQLLLYGLQHFWPDAVAGTPVQYHGAPIGILLQGTGITAFCVFAVVVLCVARAGRRPVRSLLQGDLSAPVTSYNRADALFKAAFLITLPMAAVTLIMGFFDKTGDPTTWFFLAGMTTLATLLFAYGLFLGKQRRSASSRLSLASLLIGQLARRRSRSLGVAAVTGSGVFMVLSVVSMQAAMNYAPERRESGAGGFSVFATTTLPVRAEGEEILGMERQAVVPLRMREGDDAGCLNLNRARAPRVLGVAPEALADRQAFGLPGEAERLWALLDQPLGEDVFPALVGDADTAMWGLQAKTDPQNGTEYSYADDKGRSFRLRAVGKLPMRLSLFQGSLLISEQNFMRLFPNEGGYRAFLIETPDAAGVAAGLNREYGRQGMEAVPSSDRLRAFYAVERAYLALFLVLGGLGLLLGAGGAAVITWRTLAERRAEFALLTAVGFEADTLRRMTGIESAGLVAAGLLIGAFAAGLATSSLLFRNHAPLDWGNLMLLVAVLLFVYLGTALAITLAFLRNIPLSALRKE